MRNSKASRTGRAKGLRVVALLSITPIGTGTTSLSKYVGEAVSAISSTKGVKLLVTPMGTVLEARSLNLVLGLVEKAHEALFKLGVTRVLSTLLIDDRKDKPRAMEDKVKAVEKLLKRATNPAT